MGWRDFQLPKPKDNIDNIDNMKPESHFVDKVYFVYEGKHKDIEHENDGHITPTRKRLCYWLQQEVQDCQLPCWAWSRDRGDGRTCPHFRAYMRQRKNIPFQCESFREPGDDSGCSHY